MQLLNDISATLDTPEVLRQLSRTIGHTDLIEIPTQGRSARIFAKLELQNPYGTIKDRVALAMLEHLLRTVDRPITRVLEYTGGSLGIALAKMCARLKIPLTLVVSHVSEELAKLEQQGACALVRMDPALGFWAVMKKAEELANENPHWHFLYQHRNLANIRNHEMHTGQEILQQLAKNRISSCDAWVASIGTGGSLVGVYKALLTKYPSVKMVAVSPKELPYGSNAPPNGLPKFAGSGGLGCGRKQPFVEPYDHLLDEHFHISLEEAQSECRRFFDSMGFSIGTSSGANLLAAKQIAKSLGPGKNVVTVFPS